MGVGIKDFNTNMAAPLEKMKEMKTQAGGWNKHFKSNRTALGRFALGFREFTHGMRGFRMEMLGVMFFGMAMQRMFSSMLKPATKNLGIFELWSETMGLVFLPIMITLMPLFLKLITFLINLATPAKTFLGIMAIMGMVMGGALFFIGQFVLGIGSITLAISKLNISFTLLASRVATIFAGMAVIVAGVVLVMEGKFEGIGLIIAGVGIALITFIGIWALLPIAVGAAVFLIIKYWTNIKNFFINIWESIKLSWENFINWAKDFGRRLGDAIWNALPGWLQKFISKGLEIGGNIVSGAKRMLGFDDFIWRAGQGAIGINPNDNLVGFKGAPPNIGGGAATMNVTYNISVADASEIERALMAHDQELLNNITRNT